MSSVEKIGESILRVSYRICLTAKESGTSNGSSKKSRLSSRMVRIAALSPPQFSRSLVKELIRTDRRFSRGGELPADRLD